jgi:hypothetical protein
VREEEVTVTPSLEQNANKPHLTEPRVPLWRSATLGAGRPATIPGDAMARITISNVLRRLWATVAQRSDKLLVQLIPSMRQLPDVIGNRLYVVGTPGKYKWAILSCPCGCNERIDVCLMPSARPRWGLTLRNGRASLSPSIWVPSERCGSHFWIRRNQIIWCRDFDGQSGV